MNLIIRTKLSTQALVLSTSTCTSRQVRQATTHQHLSVHDTVLDNNEIVAAEAGVKSYEEIPGPRGLPLLGSALDYTMFGPYSPKEYTIALKHRHAEFGPIFREKIVNEEFVYVSDPRDVAVLARNEGKYPCRPHPEALVESRHQQGLPLGVTAMQGEEWLNNRNAANPIMMKPKSVRKARNGQQQVTDDFIEHIRHNRDVSTGEVGDLEFGMNKWALESVAVILLDMRLGLFREGESKAKKAAKKLHHCMGVFFDMGARLLFCAPFWKIWETEDWKRLKQSQEDEFKYAGMLIDQKLTELGATASTTSPQPKCPFPTMQSGQLRQQAVTSSGSREANSLLEHVINIESLTREEAVVLTLEMLAGGIDTTSSAAIFTLYQLCRNQRYQEKMRQLALKSSKEADNEFVRLMKGCVFEAMRLNPLTYANARVTEQDLVLKGYKVPAGTCVRITPHLMCLRDPEYFPKPEDFIPERWMDKNSEYACKEQFAFTPFGHGARQCVGRRVAIQELELLFRALFTNYQVYYHHGDIGTKVRLFNRPNLPPNFSFTDL